MSPRGFGFREGVLAAGALHSNEAEAGGCSEESQKKTAHAEQILEAAFPGKDFEVTQNPLLIAPDFRVSYYGNDGKEHEIAIKPPAETDADQYLIQEMTKVLGHTEEQGADRENIARIVESLTIVPSTEALIRERMHGDPTPHIVTNTRGETLVQIRISNNAHDNTLNLDATTAAAWIGPGYSPSGAEVLMVKVTNEDGSKQSAYWNLDGSFGADL